ncbi:MAG: aldo/keto reductase [Planctomycetia bacterium]|nr:aldo/keto reductase [Planctomycetia bacterium]
MFTRTYKNSSEKISLLGFGAMRLPVVNVETQEIDVPLATSMLDDAWNHGVNYFDTAYPYHFGQSEIVVGEALSKHPRDSFYLANKMPVWMTRTADDVKRIFNEQLQKCRVDYFDFYLLHNLSAPKMPRVESLKTYEFLAEQKKEGRIRHLGFSFHDTPQALRPIVDRYAWDFAQIQLNYLDWELLDAKGQYEILTEHELPVVVMEPVRGGALSSLSPEAVEILQTANPYVSTTSWALRFAASLPNVLTVLSGMSTPQQLADNIHVLSAFQPLTPLELETIEKAVVAYRAASPIPCTGCRYCMDCPSGVDIPKVFAVYNHYLTTQRESEFLGGYFMLGEQHQAHQCVACGACLTQCPQHIDIPKQMGEIAHAFGQITKPDWFG